MRSTYLSLYRACLPPHFCYGWRHKPYQYISSTMQSVLYTHPAHQYWSVQHQCALLRIFSLRNLMRHHDFAHLAGLAPPGGCSLDVTHACHFCNACSQAIVYHCFLIKWNIFLRIQLFRFYMWMLQVRIKSTMSDFNNYLTLHFYEIVDDIFFILDVPKLYHSFPPNFTNSDYPDHITNPEGPSYSLKKKKKT